MGKTLYQKITEILKQYPKEQVVSNEEFTKEILMKIGSHPDTYKRVSNTIRSLKLIEEFPDGFKIN